MLEHRLVHGRDLKLFPSAASTSLPFPLFRRETFWRPGMNGGDLVLERGVD